MTMIYFKHDGRKALKIGNVISFCMFLRDMRNNLCYLGTIENNMVNCVEVTYFKN